MQEQQNGTLPEPVITAIRSGRKIEAIKELRASTGMGLKDAKEAVEAFINGNPHIVPERARSSGKGMSDVVKVAIVLALGVLAYLLLS